MHRSLSLRPTLLPLLLLSIASSVSHAAVQDRISAVSSTSRVTLAHTIPRRALGGTDLGPVSAGLKLDSLMLSFNMTDAQQAALTQLLVDLQNPSSPRYHQWLTPEEFGAQFGLSAADLAKVSSWLTSQGFTITGTARGSNFITFSGTAGQVQQAFGTSIHNMLINGEQHISNVSDPVLPVGLASVVTNLSGLNDIKLKSRARTRVVKLPAVDTSGVHPDFTSSITGTHYVAPGDFYTIYNEAPLIASSINGQGITVAVMGQTDINLADVTAFRTASGLCTTVNTSTCPTPLPTVMLYGNDPGTSTGDLPEAMLDVEWAGATAPNAKILYVNSNNVISTSLVNAINNNLAPIISISYGDCEVNFGATFLTQLNQNLQQANAQGQTVVSPAGDSGATDCDFETYPAVDGLAVDFPGSSPFATSAGGSMFNEGSGTYWNSNSSPSVNNAGSALSYIPEAVWNESSVTNGLGASGGGFSLYFTKPYWQLGTPQDFSRDVPDLALNAASNHDGTLYCVSGSCVNGTFRASDGQSLSVVGGTSVATPQLAGVLALVEQKIGSKIGNAGPGLYALANSSFYSSVFNDITTGNNTSACTAGTINCPAGGVIGYSATTGYDQATGWGSVNASNLATDWNKVTPIPPSTTIGQNNSVTTLTTTSPVCGVSNASLALSIKVASASSSSSPTGTVQLLVDNAITGSPISLSGGSATFNFSTAGLTSGSHNITALYSGDVNFATSKGYITTDVVSSSKPDFAFTPCTANTTTVHGTAAPGIAFTVAAVNGFTGTVSFTANSDDATLAATYAFTPTTVTTSGTTNFVLYAYSTNATTSTGLNKLHAAKQEPIHAPWYVAGSGASLACVLLLVLPRRRRWGALLMVVISVAVLSAAGCGSSSSTSGGGGGGGTTTPAAPGTYSIQVTASATTSNGLVSHSTTVLFTVQ